MKYHRSSACVQVISVIWLSWLVLPREDVAEAELLLAGVSSLGGIEMVLESLAEHQDDVQIEEAAGLFLTRVMGQNHAQNGEDVSLAFGASDQVVPMLIHKQRMVEWEDYYDDDNEEEESEQSEIRLM